MIRRGEQTARLIDPQPGEGLVGRAVGRKAKRGAEVEATESHDVREVLERDVLVELLAHVGDDPAKLPWRKPTSGGPFHVSGEARVGPQEVQTYEVHELLEEQGQAGSSDSSSSPIKCMIFNIVGSVT